MICAAAERLSTQHSALSTSSLALSTSHRMRSISILGSTGSVGRSTLAVVDAFPDSLRVAGLAAGRNIELLIEQIERYRPTLVSVRDEADVDKLRNLWRHRLSRRDGAPGAAAPQDDPEIVHGSE